MLHIILLKFSENKGKAAQFMEGHNEWIRNGFEQKIFLLAGSLQPGIGGAIIAHNITNSNLKALIQKDPFVAEKIVDAEILEIDPKKTSPSFDKVLNIIDDSKRTKRQ